MSDRQKQNAQKQTQKPKPAPKQAGLEQAPAESLAQGIGPERSGSPADLPTTSNNRGLRQAQVAQLQKQHGNAFVQRMMAQRAAASQSSVATQQRSRSNNRPATHADNGQPATMEGADLELGPAGSPTMDAPEPPPAEADIHPWYKSNGKVVEEELPPQPEPEEGPLEEFEEEVEPQVDAADQDMIQRQVKAGASAEASATGFKVNLNVEPSKTISAKFAEVKFSTPLAVEAELKAKGNAGANAGMESKKGGEKAAKASVEIYKSEAKAAGASKFAELAHQDIEDNGWEIDKVDWEGELGTGKTDSGTGDKVSIATAVKITFKNGQEHTVKVQLFEKSAEAGLEGPKFEMEHKFKLAGEKLWENKDAELTVSGSFSLKAEVSPKWSAIFLELAKKGGKEVARLFARAALRGLTSFLLGPGGFALGGVITVFVAYQQIQTVHAIKDCIKKAEEAVHSYVGGFCDSWGVSGLGGSSSAVWYNEGKKDGTGRLTAQIKKIQAHPVFKPWNFTDDELRGALRTRLSERGDDIYKQARKEVEMKIYTQYVIEFYHKQNASFLTPTYQARNDALQVARVLNVPESVVPVED